MISIITARQCRIGVMGFMTVAVWLLGSAAVSHGAEEHSGRSSGDNVRQAASKPILVGTGDGDDRATAIEIASLPFTDSRSTCDYTDNYLIGPCGCFEGFIPPLRDVVYRFTPKTAVCVNVNVPLQSNYPKTVSVSQEGGGSYDCGTEFVAGFPMRAGSTYYLYVEDLDPGDCGEYTISVTEDPTCCATLDRPPEALDESEPTDCLVPQAIDCPTTIYGTYGRYREFVSPIRCDYRNDADRYRIALSDASTLRVCVRGELPTVIGIDPAGTCVAGEDPTRRPVPACEAFCEDFPLEAGAYWVFVSSSEDGTEREDDHYLLSVSSPSCGPTPSRLTSWGRIKAIYR